MITETLGNRVAAARSFQTQLFKVVLLTLYVDVKEPAFLHIPDKKKLNFAFPHCPAFAQGYGGQAGQN